MDGMMDAEEACGHVDGWPDWLTAIGVWRVARTLRQALAEAQRREEIIAGALTDSENEAERFRKSSDALRRKLDAAMKAVEAGRNYRSAVKASYRTNCGKDGFSEAMAAKRETGCALDDALAALESDQR